MFIHIIIDCETCFTVFYNMTSPTRPKERTASEIRESIFHFQQSRLEEDGERRNDPIPSNNTCTTTTPTIQLPRSDIKKKVSMNDLKTPSKKYNPNSNTPTPNKDSGTKRSLTALFFSTPKPARPALHAFF
jgi:hypothetical protein